jgi:hypothetical protein
MKGVTTMRLFHWFCVLAALHCQPVLAAQAPPEGAAAVQPAGATILARVNGTPITEQQVLRRLQAVHGDVEPYRQDANRWRRMLEAGIEAELRDRLLLQAAVAEKLKVSEHEVQEARERSRKLLGDDGFRTMLDKQGATEADYDAFLRERLLIDKYQAKLFKDLTVDEEALRTYYSGHRERFTRPRRVQLETTLVQNSGAARDLVKALRAAGNSAAPPGQQDDKVGAAETTQRGWVTVADLPARLRTPLATARAGDVLEPVEESGRIRIVQVLAVEEARPPSFDEAEEGLRAVLLRRKQQSLMDDWYIRTSQHAVIEYMALP